MKPGCFGIVIPCHAGDTWLAKAALESVGYFAPEIPRCLLVDGKFDATSLATRYDAELVYRRSLTEPFLASGYKGTHSKMAAFWYSPFDSFLMMDADAFLWGDPRPTWDNAQADVIVHRNTRVFTLAEVKHWFYDPVVIQNHFPDFTPHGHQLACSGVFYARRGILPVELYEEVLEINASIPDSFFIGEQGYLSFLFQLLAHRKLLKLSTADFQHVACDYSYEETRERFPMENGVPIPAPQDFRVLHYAGVGKPLKENKAVYSEPATFLRRKAMKRKGGVFGAVPDAAIALEDFLLRNFYKRTIAHRAQRRVQIALSRLWNWLT